MSEQIVKELGAVLFDEEVVVWERLEEYFLKQNLVRPYVEGSTTLPARRMIRELLRMAATQLPTVISPKIAESLAVPATSGGALSKWDKPRGTKSAQAKGTGKRGRKPMKKPDPKPTHRTVWNRKWTPRPGAAE